LSTYRQVGIETGVASASAHQLVQMLFDGLLEAIMQAHGSMRQGQIAAKGRAIGRAVRIVDEGLKAGLDLRSGGTLAQDLDDLYAYITLRLTQANLRNDEAALNECLALIQPLHEAWGAIRPAAQVAHV
jgi:flagellar protein FliS